MGREQAERTTIRNEGGYRITGLYCTRCEKEMTPRYCWVVLPGGAMVQVYGFECPLCKHKVIL